MQILKNSLLPTAVLIRSPCIPLETSLRSHMVQFLIWSRFLDYILVFHSPCVIALELFAGD